MGISIFRGAIVKQSLFSLQYDLDSMDVMISRLKKVAIPAISGGRPSPLPSGMEINGNRSPACFGGGAIRSEMNLRLKDSPIVWSA